MGMTHNMQQLLDQVAAILPDSDEDLIYRGVVAGVAERMMVLNRATERLQKRYGSKEALEGGIPRRSYTVHRSIRVAGHPARNRTASGNL